MPIKRSKINEIDFTGDDEDEPVTYCQNCIKVGLYERLQPRRYDKDALVGTDDENWRQCYRCGRIVEIYNIKYETERLRGFTEPSADPFDFGKANISGTKLRRDENKKKTQMEDYSYIKEPEIRAALRSGSILVHYSQSDPIDVNSE